MKITDVKVSLTRRDAPESRTPGGAARRGVDVVVLQVQTDEGLEGHSMVYCGVTGTPAAHFYAEVIRPFLTGRDPVRIEAIWQDLLEIDRFHAFMPINWAGPVDVALWDLAGKRAGLPLWQLLGGYRERVPCYRSGGNLATIEDYVEDALATRAMRFKGYKDHCYRGVAFMRELAPALRQAVGPDFHLMHDPVARYDHREALLVGRALERQGYYWYEEPLADVDLHGYVELCRALDIPIAGVEFVGGGVYTAAQYVAQRAVDIVRSDVSWKGGFTGVRKTAALAEAFGLKCELHLTVNSLLQVANLHAACAIRNCDFLEVASVDEGETWGLKREFRLDAEGCLAAPTGPGLGVDLDWDVLDRHTVLRL
jgi:L-alanine-DL-glutamate epimerase-like enolase superfamily enzyme